MDIAKGRDWSKELRAEEAALKERLEEIRNAIDANRRLLERWSQIGNRTRGATAGVGMRHARIYEILQTTGGPVGTRVVQEGLRKIGDHKAATCRSTVDSALRRGAERGLWEKVGPALWKAIPNAISGA